MLDHLLTQLPLTRREMLDALGVRDAVPEACFDSLVNVACQALGVPVAMLSFFENEWVWVKAAVGWEDRRYRVEDSLCRFADGIPGGLVLRDIHADARFSALPVVRRHPEMAAFAGMAVRYGGQFIGTLSVLDTVPRRFTASEQSMLAHLVAVAEGLLDSRMARWQLQQEERESRLVSEMSSDWSWATDRSDRYIRIRGASFEAKVGWAPERFVGQPVLGGPEVDLLGHPVTPARTFGDLLAARRDFGPTLVQITTRTGFRIVSRSAVARFSEGEFDGFLGVSTDVTALVEANRRLHEATVMKDAAERASKGKTAFLSQVSHEFRTPLNAIMGFTQLLQMDGAGLTEVQQRHLGHVRDASDRLLALTDDMLKLGRIENGVIELARTDVPLAQLVRSAALLVANVASDHRVTIDVDVPDDLHVRADAKALDQVVTNLLSNAIKYNREGGKVSVHAAGAVTEVLLRVEDTGQGMTEAQLSRLFEPFNRLGAERSEIPGTGLGLVIAKALVDAMGARIDVTSEPGVGTRFQLRLPRAPAPSD